MSYQPPSEEAIRKNYENEGSDVRAVLLELFPEVLKPKKLQTAYMDSFINFRSIFNKFFREVTAELTQTVNPSAGIVHSDPHCPLDGKGILLGVAYSPEEEDVQFEIKLTRKGCQVLVPVEPKS